MALPFHYKFPSIYSFRCKFTTLMVTVIIGILCHLLLINKPIAAHLIIQLTQLTCKYNYNHPLHFKGTDDVDTNTFDQQLICRKYYHEIIILLLKNTAGDYNRHYTYIIHIKMQWSRGGRPLHHQLHCKILQRISQTRICNTNSNALKRDYSVVFDCNG